MIPVARLAPGNQFDQTLLDDLFDNRLYPTGLEFKRFDGYPPHVDGCVLLVPGRYWAKRCTEISEAISRYQWVLFIRTGDEEDELDIDRIVHSNVKFWLQTPRADRKYPDCRFIGIGYTPHTRFYGPPPEKNLDVFLSAQNTHTRRAECFNALKPAERQRVEQTSGFTEGMSPVEYAECMSAAKVAPCPSGAVSPESFRLYEALEAHAVPIADDISPTHDSAGYWNALFPDAPFPIISDYVNLPGYIQDQLKAWPANANRITAWWMKTKRTYAHWLRDDLEELGAL